MIIYPRDIITEDLLNSDFCIIGSGPSGISIALELAKAKRKVILISGGIKFENSKNQNLYIGKIAKKSTHEPLEENRRRVFGGTSTVWGGRCIPFDKIDFEKRDWIPFSGWPISYEELVPYYKQANSILKAGYFEYDLNEDSKIHYKEIFEGFDNDEIQSNKLEKWSTPVNFAVDYFDELEKNPFIKVLIDTHVIKIENANEKEVISSVLVSNRKINFQIFSKYFVLSCGGIENPRILLSSKNKFHPNGIGNDFDVVGRYYMSHFLGFMVDLMPKNRKKIVFDFERDNDNVYFRRRWWITDTTQKKEKIGNLIFFLHNSQDVDGHREPIFSLVFLIKFIFILIRDKSLKKIKLRLSENKEVLKVHLNILFRNIWKQIPQIVFLFFMRFKKRRLPFILPSINTSKLGLFFQSEQVPNPESKITLSENEFDEFGIPRAVVDINFTELDLKTITKAHKIFLEQFDSKNLGTYTIYQESLEKSISKLVLNFNSAAHHLGTTRMSDDVRFGVVDKNCKVHGITNLYISGSSVFPTGSHANPTLTNVALSLKLADHLKKL
jgi:choline dehydrogenase-like flavoprotein